MKVLATVKGIDHPPEGRVVYTLSAPFFEAEVTMTDQHFHVGQHISVEVSAYSTVPGRR